MNTSITTVFAPMPEAEVIVMPCLQANYEALHDFQRIAVIDQARPTLIEWLLGRYEVHILPPGKPPRMKTALALGVSLAKGEDIMTVEHDVKLSRAAVETLLAQWGAHPEATSLSFEAVSEERKIIYPTSTDRNPNGLFPWRDGDPHYAEGLLRTSGNCWSATMWRGDALREVPWNKIRKELGMVDHRAIELMGPDKIHLGSTTAQCCHYPHTGRWALKEMKARGEPKVDGPRRVSLGRGKKPGYVTIDKKSSFITPDSVYVSPDIVRDVTRGLPFDTDSVHELEAHDFMEHIPQADVLFVMNEIHRVLEPGGIFDIVLPVGEDTHVDPTHLSVWTRRTFEYFVPGVRRHVRFAQRYGITARFAIVNESATPTQIRLKLRAVK